MELKDLDSNETRVLEFAVDGLSNKAIANKVNESAETIKIILENIYKKYGVCNRLQLAIKYYKEG